MANKFWFKILELNIKYNPAVKRGFKELKDLCGAEIRNQMAQEGLIKMDWNAEKQDWIITFSEEYPKEKIGEEMSKRLIKCIKNKLK